jgi:hypothetical protein
MSDFSLPTSISQKMNPLNHPQHQSQLVKMVVWMLQHRLLLQLHTYVYFMPTASGPSLPQVCINNTSGYSLSAFQQQISNVVAVYAISLKNLAGTVISVILTEVPPSKCWNTIATSPQLNVMVEWGTLQLHIQEVLGSNLSPGDQLS